MTIRRQANVIACTLALGALSLMIAWCGVFSGQNLASYDDEGMLMIGLRRFLEGRVLYDDISTIYGPFYYFYQWCAHVLTGSAVTHDSVRYPSMFFWVVCTLLVFLWIYRVTGSLVLAAAGHFLSFRALGFLGIEPAHPQELCITLLIAFALAGCTISNRTRLMLVTGALAGGMAATKINLGVFAVVALTLALIAGLRRGRMRSALLLIAGLAALAFPVVLMWGHHADWWAQKYCVVTVVSLASALLTVARLDFDSRVALKDFLSAAAGFTLSVCLLCSFALAHGSSVHGMLESLILIPQRSFGASWFLESRTPDYALPWAAIGLLCAVWHATKGFSEKTLASLRLALAVVAAILSFIGSDYILMALMPPFLWLMAARPITDRGAAFPRGLIALTAVIQILYAYPVAGAQVRFVAVMLIGVGAICLGDSLAFFRERPGERTAQPVSPYAGIPWAAAALAVLYIVSTAVAVQGYRAGVPLGLPGTERMRIDAASAGTVRDLTRRIDASSCTMLASAPGLLSFNFLSGKPGPPTINYSAWMLSMSDEDQRRAIREISSSPHPCVLYNHVLIDYWTHKADVSSRPLIRYMRDNFTVAYEKSGYQFMERNPR